MLLCSSSFISELGFSVINFNDLDEGIERSTTRLPFNLCSYALYCVKALGQAEIDGLIIRFNGLWKEKCNRSGQNRYGNILPRNGYAFSEGRYSHTYRYRGTGQ